MAYINKKGGTRSPAPAAQALELWAVAITAGISLTVHHIPDIQNVVVGKSSMEADRNQNRIDIGQKDLVGHLSEILHTRSGPLHPV